MQVGQGSVGRFGMTVGEASIGDAGALRGSEIGIAELEALAQVDIVRPEDLDLDAFDATAKVFERRSTADDLRLPAPPVRSQDGDAVFKQLGKAVDTYAKKGGVPVAAGELALNAEAKMMAVLAGIHGLEVEIHARRDRLRAV